MIKVTFSCHEKVTGQITFFSVSIFAEKLASVLKMSTLRYITNSKHSKWRVSINDLCFCNIVLFFTAHPNTLCYKCLATCCACCTMRCTGVNNTPFEAEIIILYNLSPTHCIR